MRMRWFCGCFLLAALAAAGCRSRVATVNNVAPEDTTTRLGDKVDISLADWLKLPRPQLDKLVQEWSLTARKQQETARANIDSVQLLPQLHPPTDAVIFAEAQYSPAAGFSLPPYLKEGDKDAAVALHLARFGDREAALKLADPADKDLLAKIDACRAERNYPVEWTRLVGLVLQNAQLRLANGEPEGAAELVGVHRQLRSVLDGKAAAGALGAALLSRGGHALTLAAAAWREPRHNKTALASDIEAALKDWGKAPDPVPGLALGDKQADVARLFNTPVDRQVVLARTPTEVRRALDLLALPVPAEGASSVVAFLDAKRALTEVLIVYRPKINELAPEPKHLAHALIEHAYTSQTPAASPGLNRQTYTGGGLSYDVALLTRSNAAGAFIRVAPAGAAAPAAVFAGNPRDFAPVSLDRSFEQNRLAVAPDQSGATVEIKDKDALARITQPAKDYPLGAARLQAEAGQDLLSSLTLIWPIEQSDNALNRLALPLWAAYGPSRIESVEDLAGGHFILTWEDATTRLRLRLPFAEKSPELVAEDSRGSAGIKGRIEVAAQLDRRERQKRLADGKPRTRLARFVQLPSHSIESLRLGMTREEVRTALPAARSIRRQEMPDGLNVLFVNEPPPSATYWPRQLFVRFGADDRVAEVRVRYQEGLLTPSADKPSLLDTLKKKPNGAPETLPSPWLGLWADLPGRSQPVLYRWLDDTTSLTYQRDKGGSEVVLRDCPPDKPLGVELPPLLFCSRGVEACALGDTRADLLKRWRTTKPRVTSNGAEVLSQSPTSPYDVLLVWYDNGKVSRIIARHRDPKMLKNTEVGAALQQAWSRNLDHLGYLRRQDGPRGQVYQAYNWNDDRTRVRIFAQETEEGLRLFTEWREWPIQVKAVAAK